MYKKLIVKNVAKNVREYGIYFLTLMIAVAVFYSFNSIESQPVIQEAMQKNGSLMGTLIPMIRILSKFVAVMLTFLILYANHFLLKRRKKELGIYMILGMSERKMSGIFVGETVLIGLVAMAAGIVVGSGLSQGLSVFAIKLFAYDVSEYRFVLSVSSLKETILCFVIIFVMVMLFNVYSITKVKLIDLLNAARKNETMIIEKTGMLGLMFLCALFLYALDAYLLYFKDGLSFKTREPAICLVSLCVATAMLIYSVAGVLLMVLQKKRNWYLKGINSFLVRQISSKMQSNFLTMTVVSLLLTGTICIISLGMGMADSMNETAKNATPYDVLIFKSEEGRDETKDSYYEDLQAHDMHLDEAMDRYAIMKMSMDDDVTYGDILSDVENLAVADQNMPEQPIDIISISDYNEALELQGKDRLTLLDGQYMINSNYRGTNANIQMKYDEQPELVVAGQNLKPANHEVLHNTYIMTVVGYNDKGTLIVPDAIAEKLSLSSMVLVGNLKPGFDESIFVDRLIELNGDVVTSPYAGYTRNVVQEAYYGTFAVAAFICCYIGVIMLIICVALLSLQQLTETNDNVKRYQLLSKLGVEKKEQNAAMLKQVFTYFGVPLIIACIYSMVSLPKAVEKLRESLAMEVGAQVLTIIVLLLVVYGSYFLLTYLSCRRMIAEKEDRTEE